MEVAASERYSPPPSFSLFLHSPFIPLKLRRSLCTLSPLHRRSLLPPLAHTTPSATISFWFARSEEQGEDRDRIEKVEGNGESSPRKRNTTSPAAIAGSPFSGSFVVAWVGGWQPRATRVSLTLPDRPDRAWHDPGFLEAAGGQGCGEHRGRQVENSAPARPRKRVNTITLPSTPASMPPCLCSPSLVGGWISKFVTGCDSRGTYDCEEGEGEEGVQRERARYRCLVGSVDLSFYLWQCSFNP